MADNRIKETGIRLLDEIKANTATIHHWKNMLRDYQFNSEHRDDILAWHCCLLALKAVYRGNLGVGSLLVDNKKNVVAEGCNSVFTPYFRSDLHAEMVVLNRFENNNKEITSVKGYSLFTSLEPCPMCLTRLITSGVNRVFYVAPDERGGMIHLFENLPEAWHSLSEQQVFKQADCSPDLVKAAKEIFLYNRDALNKKTRMRQGR